MTERTTTPLHQWTHDGDAVLFVRCCDRNVKSFGGFQWPNEIGADVEAPDWKDDTECEGGLHGWPWGIGIGSGKPPQWDGRWYVCAAAPSDVRRIEHGKIKVRRCRIVYVGDHAAAMCRTSEGRIAWVAQNAPGDHQTGDMGSASQTGDWGLASLCGEQGSIHVGATGLGAVAGKRFTWRVIAGAVVAQRWQDEYGQPRHTMLSSIDLGLADGDVVKVEAGAIVEDWSCV